MKFMDDVQTVAEAIEWLQTFQGRAFTKRDNGMFEMYLDADHMDWRGSFGIYHGDTLVSDVNGFQWQRYAASLANQLRAAGLMKDNAWELCNAK